MTRFPPVRRSTPATLLAAAIVAGLALAAPAVPDDADAAYGPGAQIVSADFERQEQGDDATVFAAISADGRYVAIQTLARNFFADEDPDPPEHYRAGGIFRFDLATKALEKVADGNLFEEGSNTFARAGASNPSINANGRYVAFSTAEPLVTADTNGNIDVYVRDMEMPIGSAAAYDLVSARDGGDVPASYGASSTPFPGSDPGADVSPGVAISADGQKIAFRTDAISDLPAATGATTPAGQVLVRDRAAERTILATARRDSASGEMTDQPAGGALGAALSGDGSTVAWTGSNAAAQAPFFAGENQDPIFPHYLWRRIAEGPGAPTRRITGIADLDDGACSVPPQFFDQSSLGPCYGPLTDPEWNRAGIGNLLPALSGDGYRVAFLTGSGPRPVTSTGPGLDLYLTEMRSGLTRKAATLELTRDPAGTDIATGSPVDGVAMSPNGRFLAVTTARTRFILPALTMLGEPRLVPGPREVYVVDLEQRTVDRVAHSYWDGDIDADVLPGATVSADGGRVAFVSFAGNFFFGDTNRRPDAFVVERRPEEGTEPPPRAPGADGPAGTIESSRAGPRIGARAKARPGGTILLTVSVPAAGGVRAVGKARAGEPPKIRTLGVATARARGRARSTVRMTLRPVRRYRTELRERGTIPGRVAITYVASRGGRRAATSIRVVFRQGAEPEQGAAKGRK